MLEVVNTFGKENTVALTLAIEKGFLKEKRRKELMLGILGGEDLARWCGREW